MGVLDDFRTQYPQYSDVPDAPLADALYTKFYSDVPRADFDAKVFGTTTGPQPPDVGQGKAALEGYLSGASANWRDEIRGLSVASGLPEWMGGFRAPAGATQLAMEKARNLVSDKYGTDVQQRYEEARDDQRRKSGMAEAQYPKTFTGSALGGGLLGPGSRLLQGATLPGRMLGAAGLGAGYGALSGAGEAPDVPGMLPGAAVGGAVGAAAGALMPPLVQGATALGSRVLGPMANATRAAINPEAEASRRVGSAIERDIAADPGAVARITPQEFTQNVQQGGPANLMDMGGNLTRRVADVAAITSPDAGTLLTNTANQRFGGQTGRITDWLEGAFNFPNAHAQQQAIEHTARTVNNAAYARAVQEGAGGIWSPQLERLTSSPAMVDAMRAAVTRGKDRAVTEGYGGFNPGVTFDNGMVQFQRGPTGVPTYPDLRFWDQVKRNLDSEIGKAQRAGDNSRAAEFTGLNTALKAQLDRAVPSYAQARAGAAHFFGAENALEAGQNYVAQPFANRETRQALANMTPLERQLFQDGFVSRYVETIEKSGDRRNVLNQIANSPAAREKLSIALGPQRAAELEARLRVEGIMDLSRQAITGNSWTARRAYDLGLAGGGLETVYGVYNQSPQEMTVGAIAAALSGGGRHVNQQVMRHVAQLLVSNDPRRLQQGVALIARNEQMMNALRATDVRIARAISQQAAPPAMRALQPSDGQP